VTDSSSGVHLIDASSGSSSGAVATAAAATDTTTTAAAAASQSRSSSQLDHLSGRPVSADNVPAFMLATSGLDNEQKLQVALCRRQAWLRAFQLGPTLALWTYAGCVLAEASKRVRLPKGTRQAAPLGAAVVGMTIGAYLGGQEGKPMMNAALRAKPVEHAHTRRSERPKEEDAMVHFIRAGTAPNRNGKQ